MFEGWEFFLSKIKQIKKQSFISFTSDNFSDDQGAFLEYIFEKILGFYASWI